MIDTHVHFWEYDEVRDAWIDETMTEIRRNFFPDDLKPLLKENEVDGVIAVQADQSLKETDFLIDLAKKHEEIIGVVGWIDLLSADLEKQLSSYKSQDIVKGWRHIVQNEKKGFLKNPTFIDNVKTLGNHNYTYGILVYHHQLPEVLDFVKNLPKQTLVLNHLAKPDLNKDKNPEWKKNIAKLAKHKHIYCKLSGLVTEAEKDKWTKEMIHHYLDVVLDNFGVNRVMFGSDWPVMRLNSNYSEWVNIIKDYTTQFSKDEQRKIIHDNAVKCYQL